MPQHPATPDTESIWRTLSDRLRQFIRSRVPCSADAEDILQEVFLRIHQNLDGLRETERLESWVFHVTRNAIVDYRRKRSLASLDPDGVMVPSDDLTSNNLNLEVAGCLESMIEQLPAQLRHAVAMYEREGVSQKDIAAREAISLSGAKSRVQRGRKLLKEMLQQCCRLQQDRRGNIVDWDSPAACEASAKPCACSRSPA